MKVARLVRITAISLATIGLCLPQALFAATPAPPAPVMDVALSDGGMLYGRVVDLQGAGISNVPVVVKSQDRTVAATTTAPDGAFNIQGLRGGVYQVAAANGHGVYRLWSAGTAPPVAQTSAIVYSPNTPVDANVVAYTQGSLKMMLANPLVVAGVVATAIAVPVALSNTGTHSNCSE